MIVSTTHTGTTTTHRLSRLVRCQIIENRGRHVGTIGGIITHTGDDRQRFVVRSSIIPASRRRRVMVVFPFDHPAIITLFLEELLIEIDFLFNGIGIFPHLCQNGSNFNMGDRIRKASLDILTFRIGKRQKGRQWTFGGAYSSCCCCILVLKLCLVVLLLLCQMPGGGVDRHLPGSGVGHFFELIPFLVLSGDLIPSFTFLFG
mmetsp:Transcript_46223/g.52501  ORF Transcript_46223/g.52501 Transcript_46223/m.52501 type:complete len:203 (+) Transcript_46223:566-1174(+)